MNNYCFSFFPVLQESIIIPRSPPAAVPVPISPVFSEMDSEPPVDYRELERIKTELFGENKGPYFTYNRVPWVLEVRKEVTL